MVSFTVTDRVGKPQSFRRIDRGIKKMIFNPFRKKKPGLDYLLDSWAFHPVDDSRAFSAPFAHERRYPRRLHRYHRGQQRRDASRGPFTTCPRTIFTTESAKKRLSGLTLRREGLFFKILQRGGMARNPAPRTNYTPLPPKNKIQAIVHWIRCCLPAVLYPGLTPGMTGIAIRLGWQTIRIQVHLEIGRRIPPRCNAKHRYAWHR